MSNVNRPTKNERRAAAREKARIANAERIKREKRARAITISSVVLGALAIIAIVVVVIVQSMRPPGPGPENMASDGIVIGEGLEAAPTPALEPEELPTASEPEDGKLQIVVYLDYMCPYCGQFEQVNGEYLAQLVETGAATVEFHPISFLDRTSQGTRYSTRAANAAACVADLSPSNFWDFNAGMFASPPQEGTAGLTNDEIIDIADQAGVTINDDFTECVNSGEFNDWIKAATARFFDAEEPNPYTDEEFRRSTPTVIVNGERYRGSPADAADFQLFITTIAAQADAGTVTDPAATDAPVNTADPASTGEPESSTEPANTAEPTASPEPTP